MAVTEPTQAVTITKLLDWQAVTQDGKKEFHALDVDMKLFQKARQYLKRIWSSKDIWEVNKAFNRDRKIIRLEILS